MQLITAYLQMKHSHYYLLERKQFARTFFIDFCIYYNIHVLRFLR